MTEFDQLIKEKAEQAQYPYKSSAWKDFAKRAGIKTGMSALQIAAVTIASLAVVAGITLAVVKHQAPQPVAEPDPVEVVVTQDTMEVTEEKTEPKSVAEPGKESIPQTRVQKQEPAETESGGAEPKEQPKTVAKKTKVKASEVLGRPVIINVDTITQMVPTDEELRKGNSRIF